MICLKKFYRYVTILVLLTSQVALCFPSTNFSSYTITNDKKIKFADNTQIPIDATKTIERIIGALITMAHLSTGSGQNTGYLMEAPNLHTPGPNSPGAGITQVYPRFYGTGFVNSIMFYKGNISGITVDVIRIYITTLGQETITEKFFNPATETNDATTQIYYDFIAAQLIKSLSADSNWGVLINVLGDGIQF